MKPIIGFIGLGTMGKGMATNILKSNYPLWVYDINEKAMKELETNGAKPAKGFRELVEKSNWIVLCLPDTSVVQAVLFGDDALSEYLSAGQIVIDCSTTHPLATKEFHGKLKGKGVIFIDAPVSGMEARAKDGTLTIMVGGDKAVYKEVKPLLKSMGKTITYMGGPGSGQLAKVINNVLFNISSAAVAEILPLATKMGLDPEKMVEVAGTGTGQSFALNFFGPLILRRNFTPGYPMEKAYKDMSAIVEIINNYKLPMPVTMAAFLTYQMALNLGFGNENKGAMVKVWEKALNIEVRKRKDDNE
ncbi:MAG: NAD(P)-dependent oxidoreductase [Deltaproteobacteria bacterium]|nr:NAD(P)-dependent oxidoreductase [Deltaproteobacteria bacterium]RLA91036.1 MAG: NAD(P)-dependent oxidoreductase [Deltaproteobacteria bacterium]